MIAIFINKECSILVIAYIYIYIYVCVCFLGSSDNHFLTYVIIRISYKYITFPIMPHTTLCKGIATTWESLDLMIS